jgi:acyl-CoA reductase-like NAD-dependent aldehyde dehydrogenase
MLIDGEWIGGEQGQVFPVLNPATGEVVGHAPAATARDVDRAVEAAARAFAGWAATPPPRRGRALRRAADLVRQRRDDLARLLTMEQGKPIKEALGEVDASAEAFEYFSEEGRRLLGETITTDSTQRRSIIIRQPVGPVAAIAPWNYPLLLISWKLAPALIAGCTVVAKPASDTPLSTLRLFECLQEADLPAGAANVVTGPASVVGRTLVANPLISKIALTGQTETGKQIMRVAADRIARLSLELGGHCPLIVCPDADLDAAAQGGVYRSFRNMGQICNAINRIYVHRRVYEGYLERFVARTAALRIGNGLDPDADLGPMTTEAGLATTRDHIADALGKGARLLYGGKAPDGEPYRRGHFFLPTVLADVTHDMRVMREETFGPVAPIMAVDSVDDAIRYANDSPYGLVAYVYTRDLKTAVTTAERLEAGTIGINNVAGGEVPYPYGGWKQSGFGIENSTHALSEYLAIKHIRIDLGG